MRRRIIEFTVLMMIAMGAGPVGAAIWQWSITASSNGTADPSINWAEGMAPSSVNDSARAMMAALAAWRNDISGANTTGGSSTAYTLTTSEGVTTTPSNGQMISFIAHATSGAAPTLQADGGNTYPLWFNGAAAPTGTLVLNTPYRVAFSTANSAWLLEAGYGSPYSIPLGGILWSTAPTAPNSSFVAPSGQCISTTTYAAYWVQQGSPASGACPGGQFAIIDMRGRVAAALDTLNASAANRLTNSSSGCGTAMTTVGAVCANGLEGKALTLAQLPTGITATGTASVGGSGGGNIPVMGLPGSFSDISFTPTGSGTHVPTTNSSWLSQTSLSGTATVTSNNTLGNSTPFIPPTIGLIPYLRIL